MKGSAPKSPELGSQTLVKKKSRPNLWREAAEPVQSSNTSKQVMSTVAAAKTNVTRRAISSPSRRRSKNEREPQTRPPLGTGVVVGAISLENRDYAPFLKSELTLDPELLNLSDLLELLGNDVLGELGVRE